MWAGFTTSQHDNLSLDWVRIPLTVDQYKSRPQSMSIHHAVTHMLKPHRRLLFSVWFRHCSPHTAWLTVCPLPLWDSLHCLMVSGAQTSRQHFTWRRHQAFVLCWSWNTNNWSYSISYLNILLIPLIWVMWSFVLRDKASPISFHPDVRK